MAACRGPQELPLLQRAKALLGSRDYAARVAEALLRDDLLGASARRAAAALIRETLQVGQPWPPPSSDSPRPTKRQRSMRDDFNRRDVPGSLCFSVAGQEFYGSAHLIRASSATLRDAMDAMDSPASSQPLPLTRPASIPEDRMYGLFLACMKHAHLEEGVATLGEDPLALWECARWLQMEELMAECEGCCGEALAVACSEALLRWADAPAVAQLQLGLGGTGGDGDKEGDALRVKDACLERMAGKLRDWASGDMHE
eukprot:jgi/Tetstr1/427418/TSEL_017582.t1